ncbi:hypothetical protein BKA67DRAFT_274035 [Truncatella angustata]|uniref:N-acetyltransferase domain-containing protein n=1 Tax=Truncatella angustata TaxID=152316 RepID=A0A9P8ZXR4_9PEZI|nr:uncharacterized protein BKA67DRAFT_274035 [Truncatella angustata]KAH6654274.1 hypothetical protein BKA67DRAFT_274035 [Truncatella angustata]
MASTEKLRVGKRESRDDQTSPNGKDDLAVKYPPADTRITAERFITGDEAWIATMVQSPQPILRQKVEVGDSNKVHNEDQGLPARTGTAMPINNSSKENTRTMSNHSPANFSYVARTLTETGIAPKPSRNQLYESRWASVSSRKVAVAKPKQLSRLSSMQPEAHTFVQSQASRSLTIPPHIRQGPSLKPTIATESKEKKDEVMKNLAHDTFLPPAQLLSDTEVFPHNDGHGLCSSGVKDTNTKLSPHLRSFHTKPHAQNYANEVNEKPSNTEDDFVKIKDETVNIKMETNLKNDIPKLPPHLRTFHAKHHVQTQSNEATDEINHPENESVHTVDKSTAAKDESTNTRDGSNVEDGIAKLQPCLCKFYLKHQSQFQLSSKKGEPESITGISSTKLDSINIKDDSVESVDQSTHTTDSQQLAEHKPSKKEADVAKLPPHLQKFYAKYAPSYGKILGKGTRSSSVHSNNTESLDIAKSDSKWKATKPLGIHPASTYAAPQIEQDQEITAEVLKVTLDKKREILLAKHTNVSNKETRETNVSLAGVSLALGSVDVLSTYEKDIRGDEPQETWDDQDWDSPRRAQPKHKDWESETQASENSGTSSKSTYSKPTSALHRYIEFWLKRVSKIRCGLIDPSLKILYEDHGIDPINGQLMDIIEAPEILKNEADEKDSRLVAKREKQTAIFSLQRYMKMIQIDQEVEVKREKELEYARQVREMAKAKAEKGNPFLCRTPAHFRPAIDGDMEEVTVIYNGEVAEGHRALDHDTISVQAFQAYLQHCRKEKIPFIVAMSEYRNPNIPVEQVDHRVIGFAFLDVASRGIFGSTRSNGKHSARMYVMVAKHHRSNRVGTALIDRMLVMTSRGYIKKENSYQWINPKNDPAYFSELRNPREWRVILMEIYIKNLGNVRNTHRDNEYKFVLKWLTLDFLFHMVSYTSNFGKDDRHLDFVDRALFEHRCNDSDGLIGLQD